MKSPHSQRPDDEARELTEEFIAKYARLSAAARQAHRLEDAAPAAAAGAGLAPSARRGDPDGRRGALAAAAPAERGAPDAHRRPGHVVQHLARRGRRQLRRRHPGDQGRGRGHRRAAGGGREGPDRAGARLAVLERPAPRRLALPADRPARRRRPVRLRAGEARRRSSRSRTSTCRPTRMARTSSATGRRSSRCCATSARPACRRSAPRCAGSARRSTRASRRYDRRLQRALVPRLDPATSGPATACATRCRGR